MMSIPIVRFDPRTKIVYALCMSAMALTLGSFRFLLPLCLIALCTAVYFCRDGNFPFNPKRVRDLFVFFVVVALLQSVFAPAGDDLFRIGSFRLLTSGGLSAGGRFILRMVVIMLSAAVLGTEDGRRTIQGLVQWHLPYELAFMTLTALHFIPIFADGFQNSLAALKLRGVELRKIPARRRLRAYAGLLYPVIAGMVVKSQDMALAMEMRGFRASPKRTSYIELTLEKRDYAAMATMVALTAAIFAASFMWQ